MKKSVRRILAIMAAVMMLSMSMTAFAQETGDRPFYGGICMNCLVASDVSDAFFINTATGWRSYTRCFMPDGAEVWILIQEDNDGVPAARALVVHTTDWVADQPDYREWVDHCIDGLNGQAYDLKTGYEPGTGEWIVYDPTDDTWNYGSPMSAQDAINLIWSYSDCGTFV